MSRRISSWREANSQIDQISTRTGGSARPSGQGLRIDSFDASADDHGRSIPDLPVFLFHLLSSCVSRGSNYLLRVDGDRVRVLSLKVHSVAMGALVGSRALTDEADGAVAWATDDGNESDRSLIAEQHENRHRLVSIENRECFGELAVMVEMIEYTSPRTFPQTWRQHPKGHSPTCKS